MLFHIDVLKYHPKTLLCNPVSFLVFQLDVTAVNVATGVLPSTRCQYTYRASTGVSLLCRRLEVGDGPWFVQIKRRLSFRVELKS